MDGGLLNQERQDGRLQEGDSEASFGHGKSEHVGTCDPQAVRNGRSRF